MVLEAGETPVRKEKKMSKKLWVRRVKINLDKGGSDPCAGIGCDVCPFKPANYGICSALVRDPSVNDNWHKVAMQFYIQQTFGKKVEKLL